MALLPYIPALVEQIKKMKQQVLLVITPDKGCPDVPCPIVLLADGRHSWLNRNRKSKKKKPYTDLIVYGKTAPKELAVFLTSKDMKDALGLELTVFFFDYSTETPIQIVKALEKYDKQAGYEVLTEFK